MRSLRLTLYLVLLRSSPLLPFPSLSRRHPPIKFPSLLLLLLQPLQLKLQKQRAPLLLLLLLPSSVAPSLAFPRRRFLNSPPATSHFEARLAGWLAGCLPTRTRLRSLAMLRRGKSEGADRTAGRPPSKGIDKETRTSTRRWEVILKFAAMAPQSKKSTNERRA